MAVRAATAAPVNLDYAASTPMRDVAIEAQAAYDRSEIAGANPNSLHSLGRRAALSLEQARRDVARSLGGRVRSHEVVFTGGGTEANHLALLGIPEGVRDRDRGRNRVIVSAIEHDSILDNLRLLREAGFEVTVVSPDSTGVIAPEALSAVIGEDVALVSVMLANNETGVIQPISGLAAIAHEAGAHIHVDAIQGYLHVPIDVDELAVDALSIAGHKVGAPVSIGALYLRSRTPLRPQLYGGHQESGRRPGTQDVRAAVALAAVARALAPRVAQDRARLKAYSDELYRRLCEHPSISATMGDWGAVDRLPGLVSIAVRDLDSEELILQLDARGFAVSAGSACSSATNDASHVLTAMGLSKDRALGALRISFDDRVDEGDLSRFADALLGLM